MDKKKKVGLVTFYRNNYGSALQCYALKNKIEEYNYSCILLEEKVGLINRIILKLKNIFIITFKSIRYKGFLSSKIKMRKSMSQEQQFMTQSSLALLNDFIDEFLSPELYTWKQLCDLGTSDEYEAFFVGSDQVWNASREVKPLYFLKFSPSQKRHTYAVSFGVSKIPKWNKRNQVVGRKGISHISIREETALSFFESQECTVSIDADPTVLLTQEEWKKFYYGVSIPQKKYIFLHFLNSPSNKALEFINHLIQISGYEVINFSNHFKILESKLKFSHFDGGPKEYVALIDNAEYICTDSFHTTIFSMNLSKSFFVFERQYLHGHPQTSRITDLLKRYHLESRFITDVDNFDFRTCKIVYSKDNIFHVERKSSLDYLEKELNVFKKVIL